MADMWHLKRSSISSFNLIIYQNVGMGLVFKLQAMQQLANHFSDFFFKSEKYSHRSIGIELA